MILQPVSFRYGVGRRKIRENIALLGAYDGINRIFYLPEPAVQDPPSLQVKIYHSGRRLNEMEYEIRESIPGSGFDKISLFFAPQSTSKLFADYYLFG